MPLIRHQGQPFTPPIVCGVTFSPESEDPAGPWVGDCPQEKLPLFHIGKPGTPYSLVVPEPPADPSAPPEPSGAPEQGQEKAPEVPLDADAVLEEASKCSNKGALAAFAKDRLGLEIDPTKGTRDWMLGVIADHLKPAPGNVDPADAALLAGSLNASAPAEPQQ